MRLIIIYQIARADFFERLRRSSFLMVVCLTVLLGYIFSPPRDGGYVTLVFDHYVGIYNSAWIGASMAISMLVFFSLIGYYLISNTIHVDYQTRVGPIIAASPVKKTTYILGKFLSNWGILIVVTLIMIMTSLGMQLIRGEDRSIDLWALSSPFLFMVIPLMALIAAMGICFEIIPWFRGTIGNITYFFMWLISVFSLTSMSPVRFSSYLTVTDPFAQIIPLSSIVEAIKKSFPEYNGHFSNGLTLIEEPIQTFVWHGVDWSLPVIIGRILWVFVAIFIVWITSNFFHRFQSEDNKKKFKTASQQVETAQETMPNKMQQPFVSLSSIERKFSFFQLWSAELKIMFKGIRRWWYRGTVLLILASFFLPIEAVERLIWPFAWIWPLALWSSLGSREKQFQTEAYLYSAPKSHSRIFYTSWLAGVALSTITIIGLPLRLLISGEWMMFLGWLISALFVPTLAIVCGMWAHNRKTFEIVYLILWYIGPLNQFSIFNFMDLQSTSNTIIYLIITIILYIFALLKRNLNTRDF